MNTNDWVLLAIFIGVLAALTKPMGLYLVQVLDAQGRTRLDSCIRPLERLTYRWMRIDPTQEQGWKEYTVALLLFSALSGLFTYAVLRLQAILPLNPQQLGPVSPDLALNTAVSFMTNTNWQSYAGESTLSYVSQMVALTLHNFTSASAGIGVAAALVRGIARQSSSTVGNFWVDLVRTNYYLLLPLSLTYALFMVSQGTPQNFSPYTRARLREPQPLRLPTRDSLGQPTLNPDGTPILEERRLEEQGIVQGPMASQIAIKMLGTNGGGYANANAAHPFENPTPLSNLIQVLSILIIPSGLVYYLGCLTGNRAHAWSLWTVMLVFLLLGLGACTWAESSGNPLHQALGVSTQEGNYEGKEMRFGIFGSALFATATTAASCGAVNAMHDSFTPLGGLIPLFNIQLGEVVFGGVGAGLYGMLAFVVIAVFIAGLMTGRSPEYLGKKIQAFEVKMAMLSMLVVCATTLLFSAWGVWAEWGRQGIGNPGPHGLTEVLYAFTSAAGNNGSAFAGLNANSPAYNTALAIAMLLGRFWMIIPIMAMAGSLAKKKTAPVSAGTFPVAGATFCTLLFMTVLLVGALNFLPALALGPIVEHFMMHQGTLY